MTNKFHKLYIPVILSFIVFSLNENLLVTGEDDSCIVQITDLRHRELVMQGFTLDKDLKVKIEAVGGGQRHREQLEAYAWILDADTRKLIWELSYDNASEGRRRYELEFKGELTLPEGNYEVYYAIHPSRSYEIRDFGDFMRGMFDGFRPIRRYSRDWGITIKPAEGSSDMKYVHPYEPPQEEQAVVQMIKLGDNVYEKQGFSLGKPMNVRIYAIGEGSRREREMYDYGWIINANSREKIWQMTYRNTVPAGGAEKNKMFNECLSLPDGNYMVYFVTDGSHSFEEWNVMPPYDPRHWGITIWGADVDFDGSFVKPYSETEKTRPIVELTRMGDNESRSQGFTLKRPARLHIYALGEYGHSSHRMVDYGWIVNASTRDKVWQMRYEDTKHAGGGRKNRLFDDIISLPAGNYIVYYLTDDSHSYQDWNTAPPFDPEAWGITLWMADEDFPPEDVQAYQEDTDPGLLVQMIRVGDDEHRVERFTLDTRTRIRIHAIGEGDRDEMYDYGWIENDRGKTIWEMTYRNTEPAGGARKNRLFNDCLYLDAGTYKVHFKTDDSHSYEDWNADPPDDPVHWGISVTKEE